MSDDSVGRPRFSLLTAPWIPVRWQDGRAGEVAIREAFDRSDEIRELDGELPTQVFAVTRLLLAILSRVGADDLDPDAWVRWWRDGLPLDDIRDYLDEFADRFDLFDPERPFFQVAGLHTTSGEVKDAAPLIMDLPSNKRLFTARAGEAAEQLSFAEAARWLVNAQAFDPSGIKSGAVGDARVKGGKGYPLGIAWSGLLGGVLTEGSSLRETLLLNLVPAGTPYLDVDPDHDLPPWEDAVADGAAERSGLRPTGPVRLFTWQSRRIRLVPRDGVVVGCLVANGDALTPQNRQRHEPMSAWRYSDPQSKRLGTVVYMPREHRRERAFWRGVAGLLPTLAAADGQGPAPTLPPAIVSWTGVLENRRVLEPGARLRLRAIGVVYGSNNSVVDDVIDDRVTVSVALLGSRSPQLAAEAQNAVTVADEGVRALRRLAENLARAAGGTGDSARDRAEERAYAELGAAYLPWLRALDDDTDLASASAEWKSTARALLARLGRDLVRDAGPAAWAGREVRSRIGVELITTARAEGWFLAALDRAFGHTPGKDDQR